MIYSDLKDREAYRLLFPNYPDVLDVPQLCEILSIGVKTAYKLLRNGEIAHLRVWAGIQDPQVPCYCIPAKMWSADKRKGGST